VYDALSTELELTEVVIMQIAGQYFYASAQADKVLGTTPMFLVGVGISVGPRMKADH